MIIPPPPAVVVTSKPFEPTQIEHPDELAKLHTDKSLTNVVHALFAVILLPIILVCVNEEDIVLPIPPNIDEQLPFAQLQQPPPITE